MYVHAIFYAFVCLSLLKCVRKYDDSEADNTLSLGYTLQVERVMLQGVLAACKVFLNLIKFIY